MLNFIAVALLKKWKLFHCMKSKQKADKGKEKLRKSRKVIHLYNKCNANCVKFHPCFTLLC